MKNFKFCPIASSSKGNCIFIKYNDTRVLIDAGISCKKIKEGLQSIGESIDDIDGIFVTHIHSDHIKGCDVVYRRHNVPIYATEKTWEHFIRHSVIKDVKKSDVNHIYTGETIYINDLIIRPFSVPHDAKCTVGYTIYAGGIDGYKVVIATDLGHVTEEVEENVQDANIIFLESNHDIEMLQNGSYPYQLKKRVLGNYGHLSNVAAGEFLSKIYHKGLEHIFLAHLSEENNTPMIAYDTVRRILDSNHITIDIDVNLYVADREYASNAIFKTI